MKVCDIDGCGAPHLAKGYCSLHYQRFLRHGDPMGGGKIRKQYPQHAACEIVGCCNPVSALSLCKMHYMRLRRNGNPLEGARKAGRKWLHHGYVYIRENGYAIPEHRAVMQRILGRVLLPGENVHHRNGVKTDNRPDNLELWVSSQPRGQRVPDLVAWAREILDRYA